MRTIERRTEMRKKEFSICDTSISNYNNRNNDKEEFVFPDLKTLLEFVEKYDTTDCYFRGQAGLWNVTSSLYRHYGKECFDDACRMFCVAVELLKKNKFISIAVEDDDNKAVAISQHYGCPTDFIDVTTSLRVAGYFAALNNDAQESQSEGCIWIFTKSDIEFMNGLIPYAINLDDIPDHMTSFLNKQNGNLLVCPEIPQLSRLNAQKGAFLWDMGGSLQEQINFSGIGVRLVFKHTLNEKEDFAKEETLLFPLPNQLESEIMRIFTSTKKDKNGLPEYSGIIKRLLNEMSGVSTHGLPKDITENFMNVMVIPFPEFFSPSFNEYVWEKRMISINNAKPNNINTNEYFTVFVDFDILGMVEMVDYILQCYQNETLTDYLFMFRDAKHKTLGALKDTKYCVDMIITLNNYLYTIAEIAEVVLEYFKMLFFKNQEGFFPKNDSDLVDSLITKQVDDILLKYYGCPITKLNIYETGEYISFWLPATYSVLDEMCETEFNDFDKSCFDPPEFLKDAFSEIPINAQIFMYQHDPKKIISYQNIKQMFIKLILPQQYAFRPSYEKLYIPDHIKAISLPYFGRPIYLKN